MGHKICSRYSGAEGTAIYLEADRICEETARKQAMRKELNSLSAVNESVDDPIISDSNYSGRSGRSVTCDIN